MLYGARPLLRRRSPELATALLVLLASAWVTEALGVQALFGAFVAGLVMPRDMELPKTVEPLTSTLLLPLFFAVTGLRTSIGLLSGGNLWFYGAAIIAVAISGKLLGCAFTLRARGLGWREALTVGTLVNTAPLFSRMSPGFAGLYQINFTVPAGVQGNAAVILTIDSQSSNSVMLPLTGISAIVSAASFLNTSTAAPGEIVSLYANGLGFKDLITTGYQATTAEIPTGDICPNRTPKPAIIIGGRSAA
jgi:hypothetical protein